MSKLYDDVKKQEVQIDDLQKIVTNHTTRIETLETKAKATPPPAQPVNQGPITVKLPDNIATNESIGKLLDEKLSATSTDGTLKKVMEQLPGSLSKGVADVLSDNLGDKVKDALYEGFRREFADERRKLYDAGSHPALHYRRKERLQYALWCGGTGGKGDGLQENHYLHTGQRAKHQDAGMTVEDRRKIVGNIFRFHGYRAPIIVT